MFCLALLVVTGGGVAATFYAGAVRADDADYLSMLQAKFAFVPPGKLVAEGHKICALINGGQSSVGTVEMVVSDLGMSEGQAIDTISAAMMKLGC